MDSELILLRKMAFAALLGGLIGFEREAAEKPAGQLCLLSNRILRP
jgi:uncharacterized membrane protein YhiD involved in acid resistance